MTLQDLSTLRIGLIGPLPPPAGGMANQTRQLGDLLTAAGATVVTVQVNAPYRPAWVGRVPVLRALFRLVPYVRRLWRTAGQVDLFHIMANSGWSWHLFAAPAVWLGRLRGVGVVVHYHGGEAECFLKQSGWLVQLTLQRADALVVPSGFLVDVFGRFCMTAAVVPNVVDLDLFTPGVPGQRKAPHLVVTRNLEAIYDNATALRAFQIVRLSYPEAHLTLAGSGPQAELLRALVTDMGIASAVTFAGRLDRAAMAELYRSADVMLNPSLADNTPVSILEAWASGVTVVSTNVGGIPYLVQDGVNASLVAPSAPKAMAQACMDLLSNQALLRQRAAAGLQAAQRYTWDRVQPVLLDVYRRVLRGSAS